MKALAQGLVFLVLGVGLAAQLPDAWQHWRYSAAIAVPAVPPAAVVSVRILPAVTVLARPEWADLRVIDSHGVEVPFVLHARSGDRSFAGVDMTASTGTVGKSIWTSVADASTVPMSRVAFEAGRPSFVRPVTIEYADARGGWRELARGDILRRSNGDDEERAWLTIDFPETRAARWRITVDHRNNTPVAGLTPRLMTTPRHVVFRPDPDESYRLIVGNPRAPDAAYDLARLMDRRAIEAAQPAALGAADENPGWVDPTPWTERYDAVLWAALILAVLVLGAVAVRTLRAPARS